MPARLTLVPPPLPRCLRVAAAVAVGVPRSPLSPWPSYPLADALRYGVPPTVASRAHFRRRLDLARPDAPPVRFHLDNWPPGPRGIWKARRSHRGRTLNSYAGGHAPRGGGVAGLSAAGIARAVAGLDRQAARWDSGQARPRERGPVCPCCGRLAPLAG